MSEAETGAPRGLGQVLFVVGVGTFLGALAGSTVNLALPALGHDFGVDLAASRWVLQAFLLAVGVLLLIAGRLSDQLGHKQVYLAGFVLFGLASLGCGVAASLAQLVAARLLQGIGGAMLMATGPALLTLAVPPQRRGRALGMLATATYSGLTLGPPLGGWIVATLGWRWTFLINLPFALVIVALGVVYLPATRRAAWQGFDWAGALALTLGLPLLLLGLSLAPRWGFADPRSLGTLGAAALGLLAFVLLQRRPGPRLLDLSLFRSRVFSGAVISALANYLALFMVILLLPFYLQEGLGRSPQQVGLLLSVQPLLMALVASPSGWLSDRVGSRALATLGLSLSAAGLLGLSWLGAGASDLAVAAAMAVVGLGTGIFISPNSSALMGAAPRAQQGVAGSVMAEARILGMLAGVALATFLFQLAGGRTGHAWGATDFVALRWAVRGAAVASALGALAASLRGGSSPAPPAVAAP